MSDIEQKLQLIEQEQARLEIAKQNLKTAITGKGVAVSDSAKLDTYYALVNEIQQGGVSGTDNIAGVLVDDGNGGLMVQKLSFDGTVASDAGEPLTADNFYMFNTGKDEPDYGTSGGGSMEIYKCASVENGTWSGYRAVLADGVYSYADTVTTSLPYGNGFTPAVGRIYDKEALIEVKYLFTGVQLVSPTDMTSDSNDEWTISSSGTRTHAYEAFNGIEDGSSYGWESGDFQWCPHWLQWQNKLKKVQIVSYEMRPNSHVDDYNLGRFPDSWTLQGSQDGQSWVNVDTRSNAFDDYNSLDATKYYSFTCQNPGYYYYYRIHVTQNANDVNDYVYIGQLKAYGSFEGGDSSESTSNGYVISNAGTVVVNGTYTLFSDDESRITYKNENGVEMYYSKEHDYWNIGMDYYFAGSVEGEQDPTKVTWVVDYGSEPVPTVTKA